MKRHDVLSIASRYINKRTTGWEVDLESSAIIVYALNAIYIDGRYYSMKTGNEIHFSKVNYIQDVRNNMKKAHQHDAIEGTGTGLVVYRTHNNELEFLLQLRSDFNQYGLFGGGIELGDTYKQCAAKELLEEAAILVSEDNLVLKDVYAGAKYITRYPTGDLIFHTIVVYCTDYTKCKQLDLQIDSETKAIKWFSYTELKRMLSEESEIFFPIHIPILLDVVNKFFS